MESVVKKKFWNNDMEALIGIMTVLLILGTINVFSSSFILAEANYGSPYFFLQKHAINIGIGLFVFGACLKVDYHCWRSWMPLVLGFTLIALILVLFVGPTVNGARRWLPLVVVQFQPAEMAKLVAIMMMAAYLSVRMHEGKKPSIANIQFGLVAVMAGLTELEPDMGTACIIIGVPILMMMTVGLPANQLWPMLGCIGMIIPTMILLQPYRLERIKVVFDPWRDAQNVGYQTVQSLSAIGSGELTGMGLGVGVSKYDYLPEAHTDFAFAIFCQENGFLGALFVFMLFAALIIYATRVANRAADAYGQILALGIMILITGQAIANLLMVGGAMPVVGVPLPFISYGGTSMIITMAAMGILINIGLVGEKAQRERELREEEEELAAQNASRIPPYVPYQ